MMWLTSLVILAAIGGVHLQCFSPKDDFQAATYSTDLSGITDFGLELYKQLAPAQSSQNFFFSPYSIWSALTLAYFGSGGDTQRQLEANLRVSDKVSTIKLWKALESMYEIRQASNTQFTFNLANRAYFHNTLQVRSCIADILSKELRMVNLYDAVTSANEINAFVSETTKGRISQIVQPSDLMNAVMVLVNAAFFKDTWKVQFKLSDTRQREFFSTPQDSAPLAMMSQKGKFRYGESQKLGARVLELPYSGNAISMFILLPTTNEPSGFANLVNNLNGATLRDATDHSNMLYETVDVQLPKFKFELEIKDELKTALEKMGIVDLFDTKLSNMSTFLPSEDLHIDKAIHKAFVEVNEEGTEAAAATALFSFYSLTQPNVISFHCNHPFVFLIHDNQTKNILFMGAIKDPRGL